MVDFRALKLEHIILYVILLSYVGSWKTIFGQSKSGGLFWSMKVSKLLYAFLVI